ncbi:MAG TPA: hypothetical protein VGL58_15495 [Caulobacteraceae bacterium]|jgi:hypothetical protein
MAASYSYLTLLLKRIPTPHPALARELKSASLTGGAVIGQFAPQLGWSNDQAAVLVRWTGAPGDLAAVTGASAVAGADVQWLAPTIRPADDALPVATGGIYVHRWFEVDAGAADEFVTLSGEGWQRFEATFETRIFGLLRAEPTDMDRDRGSARFLLLTWYASHQVWEDSRDPTTEAMQIFARRQQLTKRSWAASTRLIPAPTT